jgi:acetate kinase
MSDAVLVLNAGSSSLKFSVFEVRGAELEGVVRGGVDGLPGAARLAVHDGGGERVVQRSLGGGVPLDHAGALDAVTAYLRGELADRRVIAVGHRVVHGGTEFAAPVRVDAAALAALERLVPLAPLHQPHNLAPIRRLLAQSPRLPQVACFDTAFHRSMPPEEQLFALPAEYAEAGIRRYGFHGLSYEWIAAELPRHDTRAAAGRTVAMHLGNGASLCALRGGRSAATTMGFSTLDGLVMGTRCGSLDPGVILHLLGRHGMDLRALERLLYDGAGLLGVSGVSGDVRTLLASHAPRARLALDLFVHRIGRELGSLAAALGGLDAIVFTAGIGEHAAEIRARVCRGAQWLGVELDPAANAAGGPRVSMAGSAVSAWVIPTDEERVIAQHTLRLVTSG